MIDKICPQCLNSFPAKRSKQTFCSPVCHQLSRVPETIVNPCGNDACTKTVIIGTKNKKAKYCSKSCATTVNNQVVPKRQVEGSCEICSEKISTSRKVCFTCKTVLLEAKNNSFQKTLLKKINCLCCKETFVQKTFNQKYCSLVCRNKTYNSSQVECLGENCTIVVSKNSIHKFCPDCYRANFVKTQVHKWKTGEWRGGTDFGLSTLIRTYLLKEANYACSECGFDKPHPVDGSSVLEIDHIDGDGLNHLPANLRVLCPNCHALTPTYRGRNVGSGRPVYYLRVFNS